MLFYNHNDQNENLTLDYFERGRISNRLGEIIKNINHNIHTFRKYKATTRNGRKLNEQWITGTGMSMLYENNTNIVKVTLFLSDNKYSYRLSNTKEKVFSSHVNIFTPVMYWLVDDNNTNARSFQMINPFYLSKKMKLPLGKIPVYCYKGVIG